MFKRLMLSALTLLPTLTPNASAARSNVSGYDMVCVWNHTDHTVNFSYLGTNDDGWTDVTLRPGTWQGIYWTYDGSFHSVDVEYDSDMTGDEDYDGDTIYPVWAGSTDCDQAGSDYTFDTLFDDYITLNEG